MNKISSDTNLSGPHENMKKKIIRFHNQPISDGVGLIKKIRTDGIKNNGLGLYPPFKI